MDIQQRNLRTHAGLSENIRDNKNNNW